MKIIIALDKFKHSLTAPAACDVVARRLGELLPDAELIRKPLADGGDGTAQALIAARGGEWIAARVQDPLGRTIEAGFGWFADDHSAVVEMATANGLALLPPDERNPLKTTTHGTGELIRQAVAQGARSVLLGVGGSATVDGGVGAATALGWQFLDARGVPVTPGGGDLARIAKIIPPRVALTAKVRVLCDVDNPLCGPQGAAAVFGPQKGATPAMIRQLDDGLRHLADLVDAQLGRAILTVPGSGAAGGLAAGAIAFLDAELVPGIDTIIDLTGLDEALQDADWVITGEGRFDEQSLRGKVVSGVGRRAGTHGVKVAVLAGQVRVTAATYRAAGIDCALAISPPDLPVEDAIPRTEEFLRAAVDQFTARV